MTAKIKKAKELSLLILNKICNLCRNLLQILIAAFQKGLAIICKLPLEAPAENRRTYALVFLLDTLIRVKVSQNRHNEIAQL